MKNIEKQIREKADEILNCKLESEHRLRFEQKLAEQQKTKSRYRMMWIKYVAAAAVFAAAFFVLQPHIFMENKSVALYDSYIIEVEQYYAMQFNNEIEETKRLVLNVDKPYRNELLFDIAMMQLDASSDIIPTEFNVEEQAAFVGSVYGRKIESLQNIQNNIILHSKD